MISKGASRAENATEQGPSSWTGPQLSCPANSTQHHFKEHQLAVTLLRCTSLQCTSEGPCKTWPFVHDQPLTRRLQPESRVACKALLVLSTFKGIEWESNAMLFTVPFDLLPNTRWTTYMLSFCPRVNLPQSWNRPKNQHMIPQERLQSTTMHCTYLLALSESLQALRARAQWVVTRHDARLIASFSSIHISSLHTIISTYLIHHFSPSKNPLINHFHHIINHFLIHLSIHLHFSLFQSIFHSFFHYFSIHLHFSLFQSNFHIMFPLSYHSLSLSSSPFIKFISSSFSFIGL